VNTDAGQVNTDAGQVNTDAGQVNFFEICNSIF